MNRKIIIFVLLLFSILFTFSCEAKKRASATVELTAHEKEWLEKHPKVRIAPAPNWPPGDFFDEQGNYQGMTKDYLALLEQNLGIQFEVVRLGTWADCLEKAKEREVDIVSSAGSSPERAKYMLFSEPYLTLFFSLSQ